MLKYLGDRQCGNMCSNSDCLLDAIRILLPRIPPPRNPLPRNPESGTVFHNRAQLERICPLPLKKFNFRLLAHW